MKTTVEKGANAAAAAPDATPNPAPGADPDAAKEAAAGVGVGAAVGMGIWGLVMPVVNLVGFGVNGIAAGSTAASMMSAAAVANGGGVAAGSTVAVLQSIGAVGLATPVGLGIVATGAVIGGAAVGIKALVSKRNQKQEGDDATDEANEKEQKEEDASSGQETSQKKGHSSTNAPTWLLVEWLPSTADPVFTNFSDESAARQAYSMSSAAKRELFSPYDSVRMTLVETSE